MSRSQTTLRITEDALTRRLDSPPGARLVLGRYRLEERIGAGGFGVVWRAHDERLQRDVAVKVVPGDVDDPERARVEREALAAARLNHPGIVALYELGHDEHYAYLVSELVDGATLAELEREGAVSDRDVARIGGALCESLEHAHARGVIHRDIKPGNIMVLAEPAAGAGFAKLTDFGIARLATGEPLTATGDVVGTLAYMAPEQAEGSPALAASDVYSLALTLYEAWTGSNPVRAESPAATARRVGQPVGSLRGRRPDFPPALCELLDAALDRDPAYRPRPAELREVLRDSEPELSDEGGLVESETLERFGLTAVRSRTRLTDVLRSGRAHPTSEAHEPAPPLAGVVAGRTAGGLAGGLLVLAALEGLGPVPPLSPLTAAAATGLTVALLPRIGWIAAGLGVCAWLASPEAGREGTALVVAMALLPIPLLLPRAGLLWSAAAAAPLLGTIGLAPLFVTLAAFAGPPVRRAGLAIAGFLWLAMTEVLTGERLLFGPVDGTSPRSDWEGSVLDAAGDALAPLLSTPALLPAAAWAAFGVLLPVMVRRRWLAVDVLGTTLWAIGLVMVLGACGDLLSGTVELGAGGGTLAGVVLGALVALAVRRLVPPPDAHDGEAALP